MNKDMDQLKKWKNLSKEVSIIPLKGKKPIEKNWQQYCEKKRSFKEKDFRGNNAGIACGPASDRLVLDIDDAELFCIACEENRWEIPETFTVTTGSGGIHYHFSYPNNGKRYGNKAYKKLGFDIRGIGGQVVAPLSIHPDTGNPYLIENDMPVAAPPQWLIALYRRPIKQPEAQNQNYVWTGDIESLPIKQETKEIIKNGVPVGQRSEAIMRVVDALVWSNLSDADIIAIFDGYPIGEKYRGKGQTREKWLSQHIEKAKSYVTERADEITHTGGEADPPPLDIFGDTTLAGKPEWPKDCVPEVIENFASDSTDRLGVETSMIAIPAIVVAAAAVTDNFKIQPKQHDTEWTESARLWGAIVAEPGAKKSPAIDMATKPLKRIERKLYEEDQVLLKDYEQQIEVYNNSKKKNQTGLTKPEPPPQRRKMVDDTTIEAMSEILKDNPQGLLSIKDELSGWFGSFDNYRSTKGADRAAWLELYNGGPKMIDRIRRGRIHIPNWSACLLGGIQPGPMKRIASKIHDDGLLQRFMVVYSDRHGDGNDRKPNYSFITAYNETISQLAKMKLPYDSFVIRLSPEAQDVRLFVSSLVQDVMILPDTSPAFKAHLSKWDGLFARIVLTYHLIEAASQGKDVPPVYVSEETARRAAKLMVDFLMPNAARFYSEILSRGDHLNHSRWIAGYILSKELKKITPRDIYRVYRSLQHDPEKLNQAMTALTVTGWVKPIKFRKKDNWPSQWEIEPRVHKIFTKRAKIEKARREEERIKIAEATRNLKLK